MYLGPQHFQAQNRYFESLLDFTAGSIAFSPYGYLGFEIDAEALRNGTAALKSARGIFPDGMPFHMPEQDALPEPLPVAELFPPLHDHLMLALAVPAQREEGLNCALEDMDAHRDVRYLGEENEIADENTGRDRRPVLLARKNIRLWADTENAEGLTLLELGRVRRDAGGHFVLDEAYLPPLLDINAAPRLLAQLRRLIGELEVKCRSVARPKDLGQSSVSGFSAEGIANAWFLHTANSALAPLRHLLLSKRPHPERLYEELARLAGALCTFGLDSHPSRLPLYDHKRLGEVFQALDQHIRAHLDLIVPSNRLEIQLTRAAAYFWEGPLTDERVLGRSRWIFGIRCALGEAELIERTARLVKICSKQAVPKLVERALPGMKLTHLSVPPPAISPKIEFQYFGLDKAGPCWEHLMKTREVGLYVPGELPEPEIELSVILDA
jgi:type VI secretion system protein ImpJ